MKSTSNNNSKKELSDLSKRFIKVMEVKKYTGYRFAKDFPEITESKITFVRNGRNEPSRVLTDCLLKKFDDVSNVWLLTGEGEMFNEDYKSNETIVKKVSEQSENYNLSQKENNKTGVPYYDVDFTAGFLEVENSSTNIPNSYISHPFFKGCDYVVRASGQSMAKVICHGDAIGLVKINNWEEFFPFGEIYAIVTKDNFRMVKVITKGEDEDSYTLISKPTDSKKDEFPTQQIKKNSILSIFKVQASSHLF